MTNAEFARSLAYLAKNCAAWAGDTLTLPEDWAKPIDAGEVKQFLAEIRSRLDYLEAKADDPTR